MAGRKTEEKTETSKTPKAVKKKALQDIFKELDLLIGKMEDEENLEKSFELYKKGIGLLKDANESIDTIEKQVKVLDEDGFLS